MSINKKVIAIIIIILLVVAAGILWFTGNQDKQEVKEDTMSYLTEKGYDTDQDIENMSVVNIGEYNVTYAVVVTFSDEPKVDYFYTYEKEGKKIKQIDVVSEKKSQSLKHQENE